MHKTIDQTVKFAGFDERAFRRGSDTPIMKDDFTQLDIPNQPMDLDPIRFDMFNAMNKAAPRVTEGGNHFQREVMNRVMDCGSYHELHQYTVTDEVNSAMAAVSILREVLETIPDDVKESVKDADDANAKADEAEASHLSGQGGAGKIAHPQ